MARRQSTGRWRFRALALLWLPAGAAASALVRLGADGGPAAEPGMWLAGVQARAGWLAVAGPGALPLAFGCRRLWWLGYRRAAWVVGAALGAGTVAASLVAGPVALVLCAVVFSVPAWIAWYWLVRRG